MPSLRMNDQSTLIVRDIPVSFRTDIAQISIALMGTGFSLNMCAADAFCLQKELNAALDHFAKEVA